MDSAKLNAPAGPRSTIKPTTSRLIHDDSVCSRKRVLETLAKTISPVAGETCATVMDAFVKRERLGTTAIGNGVAIPHARVDFVERAIGGLLVTRPGIEYDAPDEQPISIFFGLLVPCKETDEHLSLLREIASMATDPAALHILQSTRDVEVLMRWLKRRSPELARIFA